MDNSSSTSKHWWLLPMPLKKRHREHAHVSPSLTRIGAVLVYGPVELVADAVTKRRTDAVTIAKSTTSNLRSMRAKCFSLMLRLASTLDSSGADTIKLNEDGSIPFTTENSDGDTVIVCRWKTTPIRPRSRRSQNGVQFRLSGEAKTKAKEPLKTSERKVPAKELRTLICSISIVCALLFARNSRLSKKTNPLGYTYRPRGWQEVETNGCWCKSSFWAPRWTG